MSTTDWPARADRIGEALARIRERQAAFTGRLTGADPQSGERWDRGQVLSHVAEMLPYWVEQTRHVVDGGGNGIGFGRVKSTPERIKRIERGRYDDPDALLARIDDEAAAAVAYLATLTDEQWALEGTHQTLGRMTVAGLVDEFIVDHLEQHANQLAEA